MSVVSVEARSFILALFIRDDGERFLLGDNGYDFIDSQLHFTANAIENDEVQKQGTDGVLVAGQVRRASVQTFDGYIGDATTPKSKIEQMRRDFFAFFAKGHHFRVIYVDCNRSAWQRKGGYLVDAPEVKELWQIHPEYHVGLNFEDVNYYEYDENAEGEEILANVLSVPISSEIEGGLEWDEDGAISVLPYGDSKTATGNPISIADAVEAPLADFQLKGETSQQTYSGKNLINLTGVTSPSGVTGTITDGSTIKVTGTTGTNVNNNTVANLSSTIPAGTYTFTIDHAASHVINFTVNNSDGNVAFRLAPGETSVTKTLTSASTAGQVFWGLLANTTYNETFKLQLVAGSTPDYNYEPYVGGIASPNPDYPQAVQTVTGENVVKICGKNLWGAEEHGSINENTGEDVWNADRWRTVGYIPVKSNTAYTLSSNASVGIWYIFYFYDSGKNFISSAAVYGGSPTRTTPANCEFMRCVVGDTASTKTTERQLELGSTATAYEPYQGQSYEVNLGKNLFDEASVMRGYEMNGTTGEIVESANWWVSDIIPVKPNAPYTSSGWDNGNTNKYWYRSDNSYIGRTTEATVTSPSDAAYMRVNGRLTQLGKTIMVELGSQATSYAAYFEPIELCKIGDYQDSIYKSGGKWYVHKEVGEYTFTGDESPSVDTASTNTTRCLINNCLPADAPAQPQATGTGKSNYFEYRTNWSDDVAGIYANNRAIVFRGAKTTIGTTQNAVKTWLASTNPMYYYALATPTDTEITNEALVAQLEAILSQGYTYAGTNNIATITPNEQGELEVEYYSAYQDGGYVWEEGGSGGPTTVVNESISAVYPVWTIYGPAQNPILENTTNNTSIEYVGMVADGQTLVIDMGAQTASLDGLNVLSALTGDFIQLEAGTNILLYSASNDAPSSEIGWSEIVG